MARIVIDCSFLVPGRVGGAEHMIRNLLEGLAWVCTPSDELIVLCDKPWPMKPSEARIRWVRPSGSGNRFLRTWWTMLTRPADIDTALFSNYFTPPIRRRHGPRFVTVIHDLQYLHYPKNFSRAKRAWLWAAHEVTLRLADAVVTVSESVKNEVLDRYGQVWESKIHVIHNPVSWGRFDGTPDDPPLRLRNAIQAETPFVLAVAAQYPHKNLSTLVHAFDLLHRRPDQQKTRLVLAGQTGEKLRGIAWYPRIDELIADLGVRDSVVGLGYVDDAELGWLYKHASIFAFPSLFEGFGLPPVEALGLGLPVLTTRFSAILEATLGLATYLENPLDSPAMAELLAAMLESPDRFRPSAADVARLRDLYAPTRIGAQYYKLLTEGP
jgi:glycosyltransferase involved in cell wall biosynthesis